MEVKSKRARNNISNLDIYASFYSEFKDTIHETGALLKQTVKPSNMRLSSSDAKFSFSVFDVTALFMFLGTYNSPKEGEPEYNEDQFNALKPFRALYNDVYTNYILFYNHHNNLKERELKQTKELARACWNEMFLNTMFGALLKTIKDGKPENLDEKKFHENFEKIEDDEVEKLVDKNFLKDFLKFFMYFFKDSHLLIFVPSADCLHKIVKDSWRTRVL